ncbi:SixA phosphatase family protein [Loktanella sp. DJP18]|uniref:SixA phosphatase family protein n=1 Tax=Loktanella sp. DJP18 TaxID=3409788 RepID=UPI003BB55F64
MNLTLILLRHAKSGWDDPEGADHGRTLTDRGQTAARRIGIWLRQNDHVPDRIIASDATRTGQTVAGVMDRLGAMPQVSYLRALYHASPDAILRQIGLVTDAQTLLVCGHNPGIGDLAGRLVTSHPDHPRFADYPTAATTVIRFDATQWSALRKGTCIAFMTPADLAD